MIARAIKQKVICVKEVSEGESFDHLRRERDLWRAAQTQIQHPREPPRCGTWIVLIPPMPTDHQDFQGWTSERNCDLRNALEFSDSATVANVGSHLCQGTAQLAAGSRDVPMDGVDQISVDGIVDWRVRREKEGGARDQREDI